MAARKLYRIREGKVFTGVCGGIAKYFDVDSKLIRLLFVVCTLAFASGIMAYIIFTIFIPKEPK
jgi:phage shock protein C